MKHADGNTDNNLPDIKKSTGEIRTDAGDVNNTEPGTSSQGFSVAASPFNAVKLELAVIIVLVILIWVLLEAVTENILTQLIVLAVYSSFAALWLISRIRRLSRRMERR